MSPNRVLRIPQSDNEDAYVLVHLTSNGPNPLDLKLVGTEGEAPYMTKLKHDRVSALKITNSAITDEEWSSILEGVFSQQPVADIQARAAVESETSITITIRKQVQGITQRLGSITLKYEPDEAIELFEWCAIASQQVELANTSNKEAQNKVTVLQDTVDSLKSQLDELVRAKDEDETALLHKFRDLLNEKKVKIREQHKIIAAGSFAAPVVAAAADPATEEEEEEKVAPKRKPAKSRPAKRKVPTKTRGAKGRKPVDEDEDSDEDDIPPPPPKIKSEPEDSEDERMTDRTASTASEDEDEIMNEETSTTRDIPAASQSIPTTSTSSASAPKATPKAPPARRDLPFLKKVKAPVKAATEETDSDDEL